MISKILEFLDKGAIIAPETGLLGIFQANVWCCKRKRASYFELL